jgi:hypothetical protein
MTIFFISNLPISSLHYQSHHRNLSGDKARHDAHVNEFSTRFAPMKKVRVSPNFSTHAREDTSSGRNACIQAMPLPRVNDFLARSAPTQIVHDGSPLPRIVRDVPPLPKRLLSFRHLNLLGTEAHLELSRSERLRSIFVNASIDMDEGNERMCEAAFRNPNFARLRLSMNIFSDEVASRVAHWVSLAPNLYFLVSVFFNTQTHVDFHATLHSCRALRILVLEDLSAPDLTIHSLNPYFSSLSSLSTLKELRISTRYCGIILQAGIGTIRTLSETVELNVL